MSTNEIKVTFLGVGGSYNASGIHRIRYGTRTSCVSVRIGDLPPVIIDMGTGVLKNDGINEADILLSHYHYDHIMGLPFFKPFYKDGSFSIYAHSYKGKSVYDIINDFMKAPFLPVTTGVFHAQVQYFDISDCFTTRSGFDVETIPLYHPGGCTGYKLCHNGKSIVYLCDNETVDDKIIDFCRDVDLIIFDAQFTEDEYLSNIYKGWGHSYHEAGIELALASGASKIALTHHLPSRTDDDLESIGHRLNEKFDGALIAPEDMTVII